MTLWRWAELKSTVVQMYTGALSYRELLTELIDLGRYFKVVNLWPEAPLHSSAYAVPEIRGGYGAWVRDQIQLR